MPTKTLISLNWQLKSKRPSRTCRCSCDVSGSQAESAKLIAVIGQTPLHRGRAAEGYAVHADEDANQLELAAKIKAALADMSLPPNYALTLKSDLIAVIGQTPLHRGRAAEGYAVHPLNPSDNWANILFGILHYRSGCSGGVREIKSTSTSGGGSITIGFDSYTDMQQARFEASTLIRQAWPELPDGVSYPSISTARSSRQSARPILSYTINAPGAPAAIMQYAEENIP